MCFYTALNKMNKYENYQSNLVIYDKFNLQNVDVNKGMIYNGEIPIIQKENPVNTDNKLRPLASAVVGIDNTAAPLPDNAVFSNFWTEIDAQEVYLNSKPTCYLILNKPGAGSYSLGEAISKKYNCIHLCPRNIINDEIEQESSTGASIDFNLKHNAVLKFDNILTMLKKKLESPSIKHRGYVLTGFPLVTSSSNSLYLINSLYTEEGIEVVKELLLDVICNLKKKKQTEQLTSLGSRKTSVSSEMAIEEDDESEGEKLLEEIEEEDREQPVVLPKYLLQSCSGVILPKKTYYDTKQIVLLQQIKELFNLSMKPDIVVHITCPDIDLITKRNRKFFNYSNGSYIFDTFLIKQESETRWPEKYSISNHVNHQDPHIFNPKYNCRQPMDYVENSIEQLCNYKQLIMPYIESKIKEYNPKYVIKLDARISINEMMHVLNELFLTLPIQPILMPKPLHLEDTPDNIDDFWKLVEELKIIHCGVQYSFNRYMSLWYNRCPVELKKRQSVRGNPKFAVSYFNHIYLLSSLNSMIEFCRNPRPFLKLKYLEPTCRIIVIGTKSSGKTMISECFSWIFDAPIINYEAFLNNEKQKKYNTIAKTILSEIITIIEDARYEKWQNMESVRLSRLEQWYDLNIAYLKEYVSMLNKYKFTQQKVNEIEEESYYPDAMLLKELAFLKERLSYLPFLENLVLCTNAAEERNIMEYAPLELITVTEKPMTPTLEDLDVTEAISNYIRVNELQQEIEPTMEELVIGIVKILSNLDKEIQETTNFEQSYGRYVIDGFPSDPEYWIYLNELYLLPDYTIALIENKEVDQKILQNYLEIDKHLKNYHERFILANDPLIKTKLLTKTVCESKVLDIKIIIYDLINKIFNPTNTLISTEKSEENIDLEDLTPLRESFEKFREDWDNIKFNLGKNSKSFIEVDIGVKTDVEIVEEVLLKIRKSYFISGIVKEDEEIEVSYNEDEESRRDILTYNDSKKLGETNVYCPVTFYNYGVLWEGNPEFNVKYDNKIYYFCSEEFRDLFQKDVTKYQHYNKPFKRFPPLRIGVIGCIGSGKTAVSKLIAKELGLFHLDFSEIINEYLLPKHFKKVGRQYENPFTDTPIDEEGIIEFNGDDDNFIAILLSKEAELRRMIHNYYEKGVPMLSVLMKKIIKKLWYDDPFKTTGFVLDGYPRLPADIEDMTACYCIPDLIIELQSNAEIMLQRLSPKMYQTWESQLSDAKDKALINLCKKKEIWLNFITKNVVVELICDEILEQMFMSENPSVADLSKESVIIDANPSGSMNINANLFKTYNEMIQKYPEPSDQSEWEKPEEARERINSRLESIFEIEDMNIHTFKEILSKQRIKCVSIDATKSLHKVLKSALSTLTKLRNRCESVFEQTFIINNDIAEMLLLEGFYFLSNMYRICPVYIYENPNAILNPYKTNYHKRKTFPVIHRSYIYYIINEDNVRKFRENPLKYIRNNYLKPLLEYPLRIGVIGPPKSGKSTLAERLSKEYGLLCLSKGKVLRYILKNMHWTELASRIIVTLREGRCVNSDLMIKAVQTVTMDNELITNGFVLDGFPESPSEAIELSRLGLYPVILFELSANENNILRHSQNEIYFNILKRKPPYSRSLIGLRFKNWYETCCQIKDWVNNDYQNLYVIDANQSRWRCLQEANNIIIGIMNKVHYYLNNVHSKVVPADVMCISNDLFRARMSNYKNVCPLCLQRNVLRNSDYPLDRKGIVQYENKFYWICEEHMEEVLKNPDYYLNDSEVEIPELPALVKIINHSLVYEKGICIVTYAENLPAQRIERGNKKFAASFHGKTYLFCSETCLAKFMAKPHVYYDINVFKVNNIFPKLTLNNLPNLGYLEQTVGNIITDACCSVNVIRPKYPGLDIKMSALLYIALYLKIHNPISDKSVIGLYDRAFNLYQTRCKLMIDIGLRLRSMNNPFAYYPNCCVKNYDSCSLQKMSTNERSFTTLSEF